ncbi:MAG: Gfo/Idh/MocA family oxidoreductase [Planctomycetia bacterium]|nr:Gfo/Idh/MocA family oxidoreductase [Planctomycetia bacterium]
MQRREFLNTGMSAAAITLAGSAVAQAEQKEKDMPFKKIKIAQIGVRHEHASGKIASLKMLPEYYEILGVAPESPDLEKKYRDKGPYKGIPWMSQEELLNLPGLEAVAIETEMTELIPTAVKCAKRGLHLHVDKPLGQKLDECREMLDVCRKYNVIMQPGYMFRSNQGIRLAVKAVQNGWLGEITGLEANMNRYDVSPSFRKWLATYRGGGMYDFGSHLVDFVVEMLGAPKQISVFEKPGGTDGLSDNTLSVLLYDKAIVQLRVDERCPSAQRYLSVQGTKGRLELRPLELWTRNAKTRKMEPLNVTLQLKEGNAEYKAGKHELKLQPFEDRYVGQLIDLAQFIRGEKKNPYSYEHELLVQKVILAASGYVPWKE